MAGQAVGNVTQNSMSHLSTSANKQADNYSNGIIFTKYSPQRAFVLTCFMRLC